MLFRSDHEKTDPSVRRGNGKEQQGEKRETPGVREEVNAATYLLTRAEMTGKTEKKGNVRQERH